MGIGTAYVLMCAPVIAAAALQPVRMNLAKRLQKGERSVLPVGLLRARHLLLLLRTVQALPKDSNMAPL